MMKKVRNSARLIRTVFGGVCCAPNAVRNSEKAMIKRVKLVIMTSRDGARDKTVSRATS